MRTITSTLNAAQEAESYRPCAELVLERSRYYVKEFDRDNSIASFALSAGIKDPTVIPESVVYSTTLGKVVTALTFYNRIYVQVDGDSTAYDFGMYSTNNAFRPAIVEDGPYLSVFWFNTGNNWVYRTRINQGPGLTLNSHAYIHPVGAVNGCAIHATDGNGFVMFYPKRTGVGVRLVKLSGGTWGYEEMPNQFIFPTYQMTNPYLFNFSAFFDTGTKCGVYMFNPVDGSVMGCHRLHGSENINTDANYEGLDWGGIFTAIPSDMSTNTGLSVFRPTHGGVDAQGKPFIVGQFWRTEELASDTVYTMRLSSMDQGSSFSFDLSSVFSKLNHRFSLTYGNGQIYACSRNRINQEPAMTPFGSQSIVIPQSRLKPFTASTQEAQITIANGDEFYADNDPILKPGNIATLRLGYATSTGNELVDYARYIIQSVQRSYIDGQRGLQLNLVHYGIWRVTNMSQPYYTEMESKSAVVDDLADYSIVSVAPNSGSSENRLVADFWNAASYVSATPPYPGVVATAGVSFGSGVVTAQSTSGAHAQSCRVLMTTGGDLTKSPTIASLPVTVNTYYWSRTFPNGSGGSNDAVYPSLIIKKANGTTIEVAGTVSGSPRCPDTYPAVGGADPVVYNFNDPNITIGDSLESVVVIFYSPNGTMTCPERLDITGLNVIRGDNAETAWNVLPAGAGMEVPDFTRPYILFSTTPEKSMNFTVEGEFQYIAGAYSGAGYAGANVSYGLVGLAQDAQNYFAALVHPGTNLVEIVKVTNGKSVSLASIGFEAYWSLKHRIMFRHINGRFWVLYASVNSQGPYWTSVLDYKWALNEPLIAWKDMHVGLYGAKVMPSVRIVGFNSARSGNLAVIPGGGNDLPIFPTSGKISIENQVYNYTGKVASISRAIGPVQFRSQYTNLGRRQEGSHTFGASSSNPVDLAYFHLYDDNSQFGIYAGYIFAAEMGGNFTILETDWLAFIDGYRYNRSRWYLSGSPMLSGASASTRCYITNGLTGVAHSSGEGQDITHTINSKAMLYATDRIIATRYAAVSGVEDATIADMISAVAGRSGVSVKFIGDRTFSPAFLTYLFQPLI